MAQNIHGIPDPYGWFDPPGDQPPKSRLVDQLENPLDRTIPGYAEQTPTDSQDGEFVKGVKRGVEHTKALVQGAGAAIGDLVGAEEFTQNRIQQYQQYMQEAEQYPAAVGSWEEVDSPGKFFSWLSGALGEQVPIIASTVASGGAGGLLTKLGASGLSKMGIAQLSEKAAQWGMLGGGFLGASTLETGATLGEQADNNLPLRGGVALVGGALKGSMEALLPMAAMRYFGFAAPEAMKFVDSLKSSLSTLPWYGRAAALGGTAAGVEASTETLQEAVDIGIRNYLDENYDSTGEETRSRLLNSAVTGAFVGGLVGGLGGLVPHPNPTAQPEAGTPQGEQPLQPSQPTPPTAGAPQAPAPETPSTPEGVVAPEAPEAPVVAPPPAGQEPVAPEVSPLKEAIRQQYASEASGPYVNIYSDEALIQREKTLGLPLPGEGRRGTRMEFLTDATENPILFSERVQDKLTLDEQKMDATAQWTPQPAAKLQGDEVFMQLAELHQKLFNAQESYTAKTGELKAAVAKKLDALEARMDERASELQVEAPYYGRPSAKAEGLSNLKKLTVPERRALAKLQEMDKAQGLTPVQYARLEKLLAKAEGEKAAERISGAEATQAALKEMRQEVSKEINLSRTRGKGKNARLELANLMKSGPLYAANKQFREGKGISTEDFFDAIKNIRVANEGRIKFLNHPGELPTPRLRVEAIRHGNEGFNVQGVYDPNTDTTFFFTGRIPSKERAASLYLHEVMTHHGLRQLPEGVRNEILGTILRDRKADIEALRGMRAVSPDAVTDLALAEELIAEMAEKNDFNLPVWRRIVALIRSWLRKLGFTKMSDNDIRYILQGLQRYLQRGGPVGAGTVNHQTVQDFQTLYFSSSEKARAQLTTRLVRKLEMLKKPDVSQGELRDLMKRTGMSKDETTVTNMAMTKFNGQPRVMVADLSAAIRELLVPLRVLSVNPESGKDWLFKSYGHSSLNGYLRRRNNGSYEISQTERIEDTSKVLVLAFPDGYMPTVPELRASPDYADFKVPSPQFPGVTTTDWKAVQKAQEEVQTHNNKVRDIEGALRSLKNMNHFSFQEYIAHTRGYSPEPHVWRITEVQSDVASEMERPALTPEQAAEQLEGLRKTKDELAPFYRVSSELRKMRDYPDQNTYQNFVEKLLPVLPQSILDDARVQTRIQQWAAISEKPHVSGLDMDASKKVERALVEAYEPLIAREREIYKRMGVEGARKALPSSYQTMANSLYRDAILYSIRHAAQNGYSKVQMLDGDLIGVVEHWWDSVEEKPADMRVGRREGNSQGTDVSYIYNRHQKLLNWFKGEFNAKEIEPGIWEAPIPLDMADGPMLSLAGGAYSPAAEQARRAGATQQLVDDIQTLSSFRKTEFFTWTLTLAQMAKKFKLGFLQAYVDRVTQWSATKMQRITAADQLIGEWRKLGKQQSDKLTRALFDITTESEEKERPLSQREKEEIINRHGLNAEARVLYAKVTASLKEVRQAMEAGLKYTTAREVFGTELEARRFVQSWDALTDTEDRSLLMANVQLDDIAPEILQQTKDRLASRMYEIESDFKKLDDRDYFPYKRFGRYTITVKAEHTGQEFDGKTYAKGEVVGWYSFDTKKAQEDFYKSPDVGKYRLRGFITSMGLMKDSEFSFVGMPPSFIESLAHELHLTDAQRRDIKPIMLKLTKGGKAFLSHMLKRRGVAGFSLDGQRVFASYMQSAANHIARAEHYWDLRKGLEKAFKQTEHAFAIAGGDTRGLDVLRSALLGAEKKGFLGDTQGHLHYIMNPGNELALLRSFGFVWYLGFNVKSALVNLTQVPFVAFPYLGQRYGQGKAFNALMKAMPLATRAFSSDGRAGRPLPEHLDRLLARGIREGFIDEAMALELAGVADGPLLSRTIPTDKLNRYASQFSYYAALPFRFSEKLARRTVFIAAVELAKQKGLNEEEQYVAGREAVRSTLFEFAKWNRPRFMQGKKSVFFLFWTYLQHMSFILAGGEGRKTAMQIWAILLIAGGLEGLPFAENMLDFLDFGSTKVKKLLGMEDPYTDTRVKLRELAQIFTDNPDIFMHGLARYYGLGPLHILDAFGAPVPNIDVSGSVSLGRIVPGTDALTSGGTNTFERIGQVGAALGGPVVAIPVNLMRTMDDNNPDSWKAWERTMPSFLKAASRSLRFSERGKEEFAGGGTVIPFDPHDTEHQMEIIGQFFGFTPTRLNQRYEERAHQQDLREFWLSRRTKLLQNWNYVARINDREGMADVREAIRTFNKGAPDSKLRITGDTLKRSREESKRRATSRETGVPIEKGLRHSFEEVSKAFPEVETPRR